MSDKLWAPNFMEAVRRVRSWLWRFENNTTFAPGAMDSDPVLGEDIRQAMFWDLGATDEGDALMVARKNSANAMEYAEVVMAADADASYVNVSGDTMTGNLSVQNASGAKLILTDSNADANSKTIQYTADANFFGIQTLNDNLTLKDTILLIDPNAGITFNYNGGGSATFSEPVVFSKEIGVVDGMTAPTAVVGKTFIYVDSADGDLKCRFGDGVTKTLATDT